VCPYFQSIPFTIFFKPFQILPEIVIVFKNRLSVVPPLSYMMWITHSYWSCDSRHGTEYT
ncbi:MAG TPA: hypothetical protein VI387_01575, partial [Candidatus Brocadiales bacterium]|nr:hypothetical protein [Candidatus Brocadiales bacterium]